MTLGSLLGRGRFGFVRRGLCRMGGGAVPVAIKTLEGVDSSNYSELFKEYCMLCSLTHPNIMQVKGIVVDR